MGQHHPPRQQPPGARQQPPGAQLNEQQRGWGVGAPGTGLSSASPCRALQRGCREPQRGTNACWIGTHVVEGSVSPQFPSGTPTPWLPRPTDVPPRPAPRTAQAAPSSWSRAADAAASGQQRCGASIPQARVCSFHCCLPPLAPCPPAHRAQECRQRGPPPAARRARRGGGEGGRAARESFLHGPCSSHQAHAAPRLCAAPRSSPSLPAGLCARCPTEGRGKRPRWVGSSQKRPAARSGAGWRAGSRLHGITGARMHGCTRVPPGMPAAARPPAGGPKLLVARRAAAAAAPATPPPPTVAASLRHQSSAASTPGPRRLRRATCRKRVRGRPGLPDDRAPTR